MTLGLAWSFFSGEAAVPSVEGATKALPGSAAAPAHPPAVPSLPGESPVKLFRELLAMKPEERQRALTNRFDAQRQGVVAAKLREYEALPEAEREARLASTEARWHLPALMKLPPDLRAQALAGVPNSTRKLMEDRLQQWDRLSPEIRKEVEENQSTLDYFLRGEGPAAAAPKSAGGPPLPDEALDKKVKEWRARPKDERVKLYQNFQQFFALPAPERQRAIASLPPPEREKAERSVAAFGSMSEQDRVAFVEALRKFVNLPASDQDGFWQAAERWKKMTPAEQKLWRSMVQVAPPAVPDAALFPTNNLPARPPPAGLSQPPPELPGK